MTSHQLIKPATTAIGAALTLGSLGAAAPLTAGADALVGAGADAAGTVAADTSGTVAADTSGGLLSRFSQLGQNIQKAMTPAENIAKFEAPTVAGAKTLAKRLVTAPAQNLLADQPTAQLGVQAGVDLKNKDYKGAATNAALGVGLAAAPAVLGAAGKGAKGLFFSEKGDVLNHIQTADGSLADFVKSRLEQAQAGGKGAAAAQKDVNQAKVLAQHLMDEHGSIPKAVAQMTQQFGDTTKLTGKDLLNNASKYISDTRSARLPQNLSKLRIMEDGAYRALSPEEQKNITLTRVSSHDINSIKGQFDPSGSPADHMATFNQMVKDGAFDKLPPSVKTQVQTMVENAKSYTELKNSINGINTTTGLHMVEPGIAEAQATRDIIDRNLGKPASTVEPNYVPATKGDYQVSLSSKDVTPFVRSNEANPLVFARQAKLGAVGDALRKAGLSPEGDVKGAFTQALKDNFSSHIDEKYPELAGKGEKILAALKDHAENRIGAYDIRLLSKSEIGAAIKQAGIGYEQAGAVRNALDASYTDMSTALRGVSGKVTDNVIRHFPGMRQYLRAQNIGRFALNPFFQAKVAVKGEAVAQAYGAALKTTDAAAEVERTARAGGASNVDYLGGTAGPVKPGMIGKLQENQAKRLTQGLMNRAGATSAADVAKDPQLKAAIEHGVQSVYGYPGDGFLNSNLAKTLNLAVFPFRFDAKVATAGAHFLATKSPAVRVGLVESLMHANDYLGSPEGKKWTQDNHELVDAVKYFTPATTVGHILSLGEGKAGDIGLKDLGSVGGLPFGVLTQMLENQGVNLGPVGSSPGIDTATGKPYTKKIPNTDKARAQQVAQDFIGSLFSFPGKTLGLKPKSDITNLIPGIKIDKQDQTKTNGAADNTVAPPADTFKQLNAGTLNRPVAASRIPVPPKVAKSGSSRRAKIKTVPTNLQL